MYPIGIIYIYVRICLHIYIYICCECGVHVHVIQHASYMTFRLCLVRRPFAILPSGGWDEDLAKVGSYGNKGSGLTGSLKRDIRLDSGLDTGAYSQNV